ncbi:MAG: tetratricopeptide repeat protein [Myxococcales bacterium]|nr:tetratricopeptide repeat protein [Myxococcales bacterium]
MRWPCILAISLAASRAEAKPDPGPPTRAAVGNGDFWREVVEPHADEVRALVTKTRNAMKIADEALQTDAEWAVEPRMRYFEAALGMMQYARKLAPENGEVLGLLGRAADELGKTRQAIEAYEAAIRVVGAEKAGPEVVGRLGAIYLRLGDRDAGIRWLRQAQGPLNPSSAPPLVQLANALASRGEVTQAIEVLQNVLPTAGPGYYSQELSLVSFTLAVVLDRDEQRSAAFEVLDKMKTSLQQQFGTQLQNVLAMTRYSPAEDQHYYLGLLYEALDQYPEARTEWALYAASGDTPWRARALDHLHAIDAQRRAKPVKAAATTTPVTAPPPRLRPRRP